MRKFTYFSKTMINYMYILDINELNLVYKTAT